MSVTADDISAPGPGGAAAPARRWKDPKRHWWLLGLVVPLLPMGARDLVSLTGSSLGWWLGVIWIVALIPLLDVVFGEDRSNPPEWAVQCAHRRPLLPLVHLPVPAAAVLRPGVGLLHRRHPRPELVRAGWASPSPSAPWPGLPSTPPTSWATRPTGWSGPWPGWPWPRAATATSTSSTTGATTTGWPPPRTRPAPGWASRSMSSCPAPSSAASARPGSWRPSACATEGKRVSAPTTASWSSWALTVVLFAALTAVFGWNVLPFLVVQAVFGFLLLEVVNYVEHYGLLRQKTEAGPLRALPARAQLEHQPRRLQPGALQPGAALRPPRPSHPPLPGAAPLRRGAPAAHRATAA